MLDEQEPSLTGIYQRGRVIPHMERNGEIEPAKPLDVLLSESKQLQAAATQLIQESRDRRTILGLTLHLCKHHSKQLEPYLSGNSSYNSRITGVHSTTPGLTSSRTHLLETDKT
jgi:hypothetical protein